MDIGTIVYPTNGRSLCRFYARAVKAPAQLAHSQAGHSGLVNTWGMRKTAGALVVAAAVAGVGGAAIAAATDSGYHAMSGGMHGGFGGPPPEPGAHRTGAEPESLHAEYVVSDEHGGFTTELSQTGRITAISATSVTARSDDGFERTYLIRQANGATQTSLGVNDQVTIKATREGEAAMVVTMRPPSSPGH